MRWGWLSLILLLCLVGIGNACKFCYDENLCFISEPICIGGVCAGCIFPASFEETEIIENFSINTTEIKVNQSIEITAHLNSSVCSKPQQLLVIEDYVENEKLYNITSDISNKTSRLNYTFTDPGIYEVAFYVYESDPYKILEKSKVPVDKITQIVFVSGENWTFNDLKRKYDSDDDGVISLEEVLIAIKDWYNGELSNDEVKAVIGLWKLTL